MLAKGIVEAENTLASIIEFIELYEFESLELLIMYNDTIKQGDKYDIIFKDEYVIEACVEIYCLLSSALPILLFVKSKL